MKKVLIFMARKLGIVKSALCQRCSILAFNNYPFRNSPDCHRRLTTNEHQQVKVKA
jgi:hypothetical protein